MAGSINKVIIIGNLGGDPSIKTMQSGDKVANFSVATSESWKDKATGERKERTQWINCVVFNQGLINVCENYLKKGSKCFVEGQLETRKWQDQQGNDRYATEVVLRPFRGEITMLDSKPSEQSHSATSGHAQTSTYDQSPIDELEDSIPF